MRPLPALGSWCLATTALFVALPAQDAAPAARRSTFALVLDQRGEPMPAATVTFAGCVPHVGPEFGPTDLQVVASDARGRAHAKLRGDLCYVAWAVGPAGAGGTCPLSPVEGRFAAGALLELQCSDSCAPQSVEVHGAEAWKARGPLRFLAVTQVPGPAIELECKEGRIEIPAGPPCELEVYTADGQPLWRAQTGQEVQTIPPPQTVQVRTIDEQGAPLPGAIVRQRVWRRPSCRVDGSGDVGEDRFRTLGTTGEDGTLACEVCYAVDPMQDTGHGDMLLFAAPPGWPAIAGGIMHSRFYVDDRQTDSQPALPLTFTCRRAEPLAGRCGRVPAGTLAHLTAVCKLHVGDNGYTHDARSFVAPVAEDGSFAFDTLPTDLHSSRLTLLAPGGEVMPLLPARPGRQLPEGLTELPSAVCDVDLQVLDPTGGPARGAVVFVVPGDLDGVLVRDAVFRLPLDTRGGVATRLAPGRWGVLVMTKDGWCGETLELEPGQRAVKLQMQPLVNMEVRLRDVAGAPVVGARLQQRGSSTRGTNDPVQALMHDGRAAVITRWRNLRTDADGKMRIPFMPSPGVRVRVMLTWDGGATDPFDLEVADTPFELRPK